MCCRVCSGFSKLSWKIRATIDNHLFIFSIFLEELLKQTAHTIHDYNPKSEQTFSFSPPETTWELHKPSNLVTFQLKP